MLQNRSATGISGSLADDRGRSGPSVTSAYPISFPEKEAPGPYAGVGTDGPVDVVKSADDGFHHLADKSVEQPYRGAPAQNRKRLDRA